MLSNNNNDCASNKCRQYGAIIKPVISSAKTRHKYKQSTLDFVFCRRGSGTDEAVVGIDCFREEIKDQVVIKSPTCVFALFASPTSHIKYTYFFFSRTTQLQRMFPPTKTLCPEVPPRDILDADVIHQLILLLIIIKASRDMCHFQCEFNATKI